MPVSEPVPLGSMKNPSGISCLLEVTSTESIWESGGPRETAGKGFKLLSPCKNLHFTAEIFDLTGNSQRTCLCIDKRAKPDTLDNSANCDFTRFLHGCAAKIY